MGFPNAQTTAVGGSVQPLPSTATSYAIELLKSSDHILASLRGLRDRLIGQSECEKPAADQQQSGVLPMHATALSNSYVAVKLLEELEQLIG